MQAVKLTPSDTQFPSLLATIQQPPKQLYIASSNWEDILPRPKVAIVGSRKLTGYGAEVTRRFAGELASTGVVIVSGLAYGVDAVAHRAALAAGGLTIAVLPTSLYDVYPRGHHALSQEIIQKGGALMTEYAEGAIPYKGNFVERNRIVSGISDALLVTEAASKSGTLHTADFALDQGREVFAVPGTIMSPMSEGTNRLIKAGAHPALSPDDILEVLGITKAAALTAVERANPLEQNVIEAIKQGSSNIPGILARTQVSISELNQALTMLEIDGIIASSGNGEWHIC